MDTLFDLTVQAPPIEKALPLDKAFRFAYATKTPNKPADAFTSPFLKQWREEHKRTCPRHGEICHAYRGTHFGDQKVRNAYFDIECLGCGEHYVELAPKVQPCKPEPSQ